MVLEPFLLVYLAKSFLMSHKNNGDEPKRNILIEQIEPTLFAADPIESELDIRPRVLEIGRRSAKWISKYLLKILSFPKQSLFCQVMERS